jgi:hypothetical protein
MSVPNGTTLHKREVSWDDALDGNFPPTPTPDPAFMGTCPFCRRGSLQIIAAITRESVITRILRHLNLASVPPPIAPARCRQEIFAFDEAHTSVGS